MAKKAVKERERILLLTRSCLPSLPGLRIKETKEVYEGEVTELTPCETENPMGGYGKTISHVIIGLKTAKGTKQLKVSTCLWTLLLPQHLSALCGVGQVVYPLCPGFLVCALWMMVVTGPHEDVIWLKQYQV